VFGRQLDIVGGYKKERFVAVVLADFTDNVF